MIFKFLKVLWGHFTQMLQCQVAKCYLKTCQFLKCLLGSSWMVEDFLDSGQTYSNWNVIWMGGPTGCTESRNASMSHPGEHRPPSVGASQDIEARVIQSWQCLWGCKEGNALQDVGLYMECQHTGGHELWEPCHSYVLVKFIFQSHFNLTIWCTFCAYLVHFWCTFGALLT